jgi:hypothetical protein
LTPARDSATARGALAGLAAIGTMRRNLDQHEHDLTLQARNGGATLEQQIAASLGFKDRQAAQQRHRTLSRSINGEPRPSQTRT